MLVVGVIAHKEGLYKALSAEMAINPIEDGKDLYEGVYLLRNLIERIVFNHAGAQAA